MKPNMRRSRKRDAIYRELCATDTHPTAEWLHSRLKNEIPDLSLGTVYTNLAVFKQSGMAVSVGVLDGKERFDGVVMPHAHFICRRCGSVIDLKNVPLPEHSELPGEADSCQLSYFGVCENCVSTADSKQGGIS